MKTLFSLLLTVVIAAPAMAQGKIRLVNDSLHLVYFAASWSGDPLENQAYVPGMGGMTLTIELWAGTSSSSLGWVGSASFAGQGTPGTFPGVNIILPNGFVAGVAAFFQVEVYDVAAGSYTNAVARGWYYYGESSIFTAVPGSTAYNFIANHSPVPAAASTWADGTHPVLGSLPGAMGAIQLGGIIIPEPCVLPLTGLALAVVLIFRPRRK